MMETRMKILGISGSLRKNSVNTGLLRAAQQLVPPGMQIEIADISQIPLFNDDILTAGMPEVVEQFKHLISEADGLLIATPEYNHSIPGVLKNALDWGSRPMKTQPFSGKPLAVMGAGGVTGTLRAQIHLRQVAAALNMLPLNKPELLVMQAWEKFDSQGNLVDEASRQKVHDLLVAFEQWVLRLTLKNQPA